MLDLQLIPGAEIALQRGLCVRRLGDTVMQLFVHDIRSEVHALGPCDALDVLHHRADRVLAPRTVENLDERRAGRRHYGTDRANVHQLGPEGDRDIGRDLLLYSLLVKEAGNRLDPLRPRTVLLPECDAGRRAGLVDHARFRSSGLDVGGAGHDVVPAVALSDHVGAVYAVLDGEHRRAVLEERLDQRERCLVVEQLDGVKDEIDRSDL